MKIDTATVDDVRSVALRMRDRDLAEFTAVAPTDDREELAEILAWRYGTRGDVLCGSLDGEPICIGGTIEAWPGVVTLLFFATDQFPRIGLPITRFIRRELFPRYIKAGVHRIQAVSLAGYSDMHRWLGTIGLHAETGPLPGYGKRREPFIQFAMVT